MVIEKVLVMFPLFWLYFQGKRDRDRQKRQRGGGRESLDWPLLRILGNKTLDMWRILRLGKTDTVEGS